MVERHLYSSFYNMLPELLRFSSASRLLSLIPEEVQKIHRTDTSVSSFKGAHQVSASQSSLWDGWADASTHEQNSAEYECSEDEASDLSYDSY